MSLPKHIVSLELDLRNTSCSAISLRYTVSRSRLGTSMPTTPLPGIGATIHTRIASITIAKSSANDAILDSLMPGPGKNSYIVTTGPGRISTTSPVIPKSASLARSFSAVVRNASLSRVERSFLSHSSTSSGGSVKLLRSPRNSNCPGSRRLTGAGGFFGSTINGVRATGTGVGSAGDAAVTNAASTPGASNGRGPIAQGGRDGEAGAITI